MDPLADDYDDEILRRLDRIPRRERQIASASGARKAIGATAVAGLTGLGILEVLEPRDAEPIVEEVDERGPDPDAPVIYVHVPDVPRLSIAWARPWLL